MPKDVGNKNSEFSDIGKSEVSAVEFSGKRIFRIIKASERTELNIKVQDVQKITTRFGDRIIAISTEGDAVFLNQLIINKLLARGIDNSKKLIGKTLFLEAKSVLVKGIERKMFDLIGVE
jgi:hypothetical protein